MCATRHYLQKETPTLQQSTHLRAALQCAKHPYNSHGCRVEARFTPLHRSSNAMSVRPLDDDAAQRLVRDVAVESIAHVVQWLLQNSLDAGADQVIRRHMPACVCTHTTNNQQVTVHLQDEHSVSVEDNGCGIARNDLPALCQPGGTHSTTRRGTSLARIASVACVSITSRPRGSFETCCKTVSHGCTREGLASTPRRRHGTTVEVTELFYAQPVRARHAARVQRDVADVQQCILQAAACNTHVGMRMTLGAAHRVVIDLPKVHSSVYTWYTCIS